MSIIQVPVTVQSLSAKLLREHGQLKFKYLDTEITVQTLEYRQSKDLFTLEDENHKPIPYYVISALHKEQPLFGAMSIDSLKYQITRLKTEHYKGTWCMFDYFYCLGTKKIRVLSKSEMNYIKDNYLNPEQELNHPYYVKVYKDYEQYIAMDSEETLLTYLQYSPYNSNGYLPLPTN